MANNKVKFEADCGGMKPLPLVKKKENATKKKKVAKKACGGKAKKKPKCAKKCEFGGVIENLATTTRMSLINY